MRQKDALRLLREHKKELEEQYDITRLGIFGSVARDEAVDSSDVDVVRYWQRMNHYLKKRIDGEAYYV
jgi:predicted nucleotidyltransferase